MKFKKLFSLSTLCLVGVMGVGLLASCDETEDEVEEDETTTTDEEDTTSSPSSISIDEGLYTFSGNLTFELTNEATGSLATGGEYQGSVDIPLTLTINVSEGNHITGLIDSEIEIGSAPTEVTDIKLTGYGGGVLDSVITSHVTAYFDSEEDNIYYHRIDSGTGTDIDTYELYGEFTSSEFMKNPLLYITRDMFGAGARIFEGIDGKVSENPLDSDAITKTLTESASITDITDSSGSNVGSKVETGFDGGATYSGDALLGEVKLAASIYNDHSQDALYAYIPTCFVFENGVSIFTYNFNCDFVMSLDLTIDSYSATMSADNNPFTEFVAYISENASHFVSNTVTEKSSLVNVEDTEEEGETVTVTPKTYTDVTTYTGTITLSLTNISVYTGEGENITYTYTGNAPIETTLDVGTYTDGAGETQYTYVLDCEIPIVTVTFNSGLARTIKLTGYGNNVLSNSVTTSHLSAYYDTGDGMIMWHRIDTGSDSALRQSIDTYENWGAFTKEEFALNPYYYITHDFFGCGQRIFEEAVNAIDEDSESIVGSDIIGSSQDGTISAQFSSTFEWDSVNLKFDIDVSLTKGTESQSKTESELITGFVSYINDNPTHFIKNTIVEDSYMSTSSDEGD
ncbi:MAG: hypothetical protein LUB56_02185 [Coprobacillus sp.]|nr:hypothetical protein [Coprobacillus sp.]